MPRRIIRFVQAGRSHRFLPVTLRVHQERRVDDVDAEIAWTGLLAYAEDFPPLPVNRFEPNLFRCGHSYGGCQAKSGG